MYWRGHFLLFIWFSSCIFCFSRRSWGELILTGITIIIRRFIVYRRTLGWFAVLSNLLGNVLAFVPFGMILPMLTPKCRNFFHIVLLGFDFSLFVETIQLISKVGSFDVDDLILNTLGGALGYLAYRLIRRYFRRKHDDRKEKTL